MLRYKCIIDRPIGYVDKFKNVYPINYGYIEGVIAGDGEEQDVYVIDEDKAITTYEGNLVAIIKREDDIEYKWVLSNKRVTKEEIEEKTFFLEKYFLSKVIIINE